MIYFFQSANGGLIKIGYTSRLADRKREIGVLYGERVVVLGTREGTITDERAVHSRFALYRVPETELFFPSKAIMDFIGLPFKRSTYLGRDKTKYIDGFLAPGVHRRPGPKKDKIYSFSHATWVFKLRHRTSIGDIVQALNITPKVYSGGRGFGRAGKGLDLHDMEIIKNFLRPIGQDERRSTRKLDRAPVEADA